MIIATELISEVMSSATNGILSVMVDVNELCGRNEYSVLVSVLNGTSVIEKQNASFRDVALMFNQLSPGDYSCNIFVANASGIVLVSREIEDCDIPISGKFHYIIVVLTLLSLMCNV